MARQSDPHFPKPVYNPRLDPNYDPDALPSLDNPDESVIEPGDPGDAPSDTPTRTQA